MPDFRGRRILLVEDEYFLADDMARAVRSRGAEAIGPVSDVEGALRLISSEALDAAVVDINLGQGATYAVADALRAHRIPFVFATGYAAPPPDYAGERLWQKPYDPDVLAASLSGLWTANGR